MAEYNEPEGVEARRRLMDEGDPEQVAAAAFELGVYYMNRVDGADEAEACFRRAAAAGHPAVTPAALINLAGLLQQRGRLEDAEAAYHDVLALSDPATGPMAAYGLGLLLASQPGREHGADVLLQQAADSGDPEYGPLAAYDLGVLLIPRPGRLGDAITALEQAARSGHAEYGPRAWFNLGELLAQAGRDSEAERAYQNAIATGHPDIAPTAAVNLGGLLQGSADRTADAEAAYRLAISSGHSDQAPMAAANLGNLLAEVPNRRADAEAAYREAMASHHPSHAPRAAYNLGVLLLADQERHSDAEAAFRAAAESDDHEHAPLALYNLGRLLAEYPRRRAEADQVLEAAASTRDERVSTLAQTLLSELAETPAPEQLVPPLDEHWRCVKAASQGEFHIQEYLPGGQSTGDWTEIVTVTRITADPDITPHVYMDVLRKAIESSLVDGRLSWEVVDSAEDEIVYESTLKDDVAAQDQAELARIVRRAAALHTVQHAMRGDLALAARERASRLRLLRAASLVRQPPPPVVASPSVDDREATALFEAATAPSDDSPLDRLTRCRQGLAKITKDRHPMDWALLNLLLAQLILLKQEPKDTASDDNLDEAEASLRRALEVFTADRTGDLWGRALHTLGLVILERAERHGRSNGRAAREVSQARLGHAIAALDKARTAFPPDSFDWQEITVDLGDARLSVDSDAAAATYAEMLAVGENMALLPEEENTDQLRKALGELSARAISGIQSIDRLRSGSPIVPAKYLNRAKRGKLLYLRPLLSASSLQLPNRCVSGAFEVGFEREPDQLTLEALLYRALGTELSFISLGGRPEGYGGTRIMFAEGGEDWRSLLPTLDKTADLIVMVPHASEGVRWELEYVVRTGALSRTLFIMPPHSTDTDVEAMWSSAVAILEEHNLRPPNYRSQGAILRFGPDGSVAEEWDFDTLWKNTLLREIEHLLPGGAQEGARRPWWRWVFGR